MIDQEPGKRKMELERGDRVYSYARVGGRFYPKPLTVVRVNPQTVTVLDDNGKEYRVDPSLIDGYLEDGLEEDKTDPNCVNEYCEHPHSAHDDGLACEVCDCGEYER